MSLLTLLRPVQTPGSSNTNLRHEYRHNVRKAVKRAPNELKIVKCVFHGFHLIS